jgi:large subunit ribosomal protein L6e
MVKTGRNVALSRGVGLYGRSKMFHRSGKWKFVKKGGAKKVVEEAKPVVASSRFYPADDVKMPLPSRKNRHKQTKLKSTITPGSVLILLAGRFRGKRVVFLKQLESGLLLVSGPFKVNGVPLRRVNQAYVIGTSTSVDISGVKVPEHVNDEYFARVSTEETEGEKGLFAQGAAPKINEEWLAKRKADQKTVDTALLKAVKAVPSLKQYLNAKFSLTNGQAPHDMKF